MSTGLECLFFNADGKHYYLLQDGGCPVSAWDWREYATCYGPFEDQEEARQHLSDFHANPGGYSVEQESTDDEVLIRASKECVKPKRMGWY